MFTKPIRSCLARMFLEHQARIERRDAQPHQIDGGRHHARSSRLPDQVIPTITSSLPKVPVGRNPISPALRLHLDSAFVNPGHEQKIVRQVVGVRRAFAAKAEVSTNCRKSNLLLLSLTERPGSPRTGIAAPGAPEPGAADWRNRQCAGLGERSGRRREVFPLGFTGVIPCVWVQGAKLLWSPRSGLRSMCCLAKRHI